MRSLLKKTSSLLFGLDLFREYFGAITSQDAVRSITARLGARAEYFLKLCRDHVFSSANHPYRPLFRQAGMTYEELESLVAKKGLEPALREMAARGIFLESAEFKGRKTVSRGGRILPFDSSGLNSAGRRAVALQSSGSTGAKTKAWMGIEGIRLQASLLPLVLDFLDAWEKPIVLYYPMPSTPGIIRLITFPLAGKDPDAWFSQTPIPPWTKNEAWIKMQALLLAARISGHALPRPRYSDIYHPAPLLRWLMTHARRGALIPTFPGSALHLVHAAQAAGLALPPLTFLLGGEPLTPRKRSFLENAGHRVVPWYGSVETARIAVGCLRPEASDDMHFLSDRLAVILDPRTPRGAGRGGVLLTTLVPGSGTLLINVSLGDSAVLRIGRCGCPWESLGLTTHLHSLGSFDRLNTEGMTFDADVLISLIEERLPRAFGGTPADFQFSEEEDELGRTRLVLTAGPSVEADETEIVRVVLAALSESRPTPTPMTDLLSRTGAVKVRRAFPRLTDSGKINLLARSGVS